MDVLVLACKGISGYAHRLRQMGEATRDADLFVTEALFITVTNVDFDPARIEQYVRRAKEIGRDLKARYEQKCSEQGTEPDELCDLDECIPQDVAEQEKLARRIGVDARQKELGETVTGLQELVTYGLKGSAAYAHHAHVLGEDNDDIYGKFHELLDWLTTDEAKDIDALLGKALEEGELNLRVMGLLDQANTGAYGSPEPTEVRVTPVKGKCILVSGHDLKDLAMLLEQTEGKGVNVYTHGEMLPCLAYPELKKYDHLVGNYGGAWQDQRTEFVDFPGAILMTTNCLMEPKDEYKDRLFTTSVVGWPGVSHIAADPEGNKDFTPVIEAALAADGFAEDAPEKTITIGFGHDAVMGVADTVIEAVKSGDIRHFFLIGGCDGAKPGRNYYTELAEQVPDDCVMLTLACGKYRFNKKDFGDIGGIPRLLDCGQCNDAYSAIQIATALAQAFDCGVNDLPLSLVLSWYEQKAVCILLTLLYLGIQDMRLGPTLPAFVTPAVLNVLVEKFSIKPIATPQEDLQAMLAPAG
jgi:hydroxylamine reductase